MKAQHWIRTLTNEDQLIELTADIVAAHLSNNQVAANDVGNLVRQVHEALGRLNTPVNLTSGGKTPAVSVKASVKREYIVCMECGKKQRTLKRHLQTAHGMTPDQYRTDYGLPASYPLIAAEYSEKRRGLANAIGLGRRKSSDQPAVATKRAPKKHRAATAG